MNKAMNSNLVPRSQQGRLWHQAHKYGLSRQGNELHFYGPTQGPVDLLLLSAIHGDELDTLVMMSEALRQVPVDRIKNPVIITANPDGVARGTRCNAMGVDLNRNWPTENWTSAPVHHKLHSGQDQDIELSPGDSAGSEPETQALRDLVLKLQPQTIVTLHSALACIDDPENSTLAQWISRQTNLDVVPDVGYLTPGSMGTWAAEQGISIITWELPQASFMELRKTHIPALVKLITGEFSLGG